LVNGKLYVGQAQNFYLRYYEHKKIRGNGHLQKAFRKHGFANFKFDIIETVLDLSKMNQREQYWMDFYNSYNKDIGYNVCKEAGSTRGRKRPFEELAGMISHKKSLIGDKNHFFGKKHTDETRAKISASRKNVKLTKSHIKAFCNKGADANKKKIYQIDPLTNLIIREYQSIKEASDEIEVAITSIACVLRKYPNRHTSGGYKWEYKNNIVNLNKS
jgi:group I intron endonuclease